MLDTLETRSPGERRKERRFGWIEASLRIAGTFGIAEKKAYADIFGLTPSAVSRHQDLFRREYNQRCGRVVVVNVQGRLRWAGDDLPQDPLFPMPNTAVWLADVLGGRFETGPVIRRVMPGPGLLRPVIDAMRRKSRLRILYRDRSGKEEWRTISPHTIVHIAGRMHLRGWDHDRNAPRDLVLSRMVSVGEATPSSGYVDRDRDRDWTAQVTLEIHAREGENVDALRAEYGLDATGRTTRRVRSAYKDYLIDRDDLEAPVVVGRGFRSPVIVRPLHDESRSIAKDSAFSQDHDG